MKIDSEQTLSANLEDVLSLVSKITGFICDEMLKGEVDYEETTDILACYSGMLAEVITVVLVKDMTVGDEYRLPGRVDAATGIFQKGLIESLRGTLELNNIPDPWNKNLNQETFKEILREIEDEQKQGH